MWSSLSPQAPTSTKPPAKLPAVCSSSPPKKNGEPIIAKIPYHFDFKLTPPRSLSPNRARARARARAPCPCPALSPGSDDELDLQVQGEKAAA